MRMLSSLGTNRGKTFVADLYKDRGTSCQKPRLYLSVMV
jgi:hypothetical protein